MIPTDWCCRSAPPNAPPKASPNARRASGEVARSAGGVNNPPVSLAADNHLYTRGPLARRYKRPCAAIAPSTRGRCAARTRNARPYGKDTPWYVCRRCSIDAAGRAADSRPYGGNGSAAVQTAFRSHRTLRERPLHAPLRREGGVGTSRWFMRRQRRDTVYSQFRQRMFVILLLVVQDFPREIMYHSTIR